MSKKRLLIVDDEENMRHMLQAMLSRYDYEITTAENGVAAGDCLRDNAFDFILCDVRMPGMDGLQFLTAYKEALKDTTVLMMSAFGTVDLALSAMKIGAYDFISKPFKKDEVLLALKKAEEREFAVKPARFPGKAAANPDRFADIAGQSEVLQKTIRVATRIAQFDSAVLITGESGTGKELFARGIHDTSSRSGRPFFAVNCASIPAGLIESELFGHLKGSFTGADRTKIGIFEEADHSTLFLDEIGELPLEMQVKLLRTLQENEIRRVGDTVARKVDVRIIAATNRDLQEEVARNRFRQDLYYRLNVFCLHIPPLRERDEDIKTLCTHFVQKYNEKFNLSFQGVSDASMELLLQHSWPGNVRELENVIQRGIVLSDGNLVEVQDFLNFSSAAQGGRPDSEEPEECTDCLSIKEAQKKMEARLIGKALKKCGGNKSKASQLLELSYPTLLSKMKEYGIS